MIFKVNSKSIAIKDQNTYISVCANKLYDHDITNIIYKNLFDKKIIEIPRHIFSCEVFAQPPFVIKCYFYKSGKNKSICKLHELTSKTYSIFNSIPIDSYVLPNIKKTIRIGSWVDALEDPWDNSFSTNIRLTYRPVDNNIFANMNPNIENEIVQSATVNIAEEIDQQMLDELNYIVDAPVEVQPEVQPEVQEVQPENGITHFINFQFPRTQQI